jgi:hypothetical protein
MGLYTAAKNGEQPDKAVLSYHALTIGAACRFVNKGSLAGSEYFVGKGPDVLQHALHSNPVSEEG